MSCYYVGLSIVGLCLFVFFVGYREQFLQERLSSSNPSPSEPSVTATPESRKAEEELQKNLFELPDHLKVNYVIALCLRIRFLFLFFNTGT